jgi:hypothetical protein
MMLGSQVGWLDRRGGFELVKCRIGYQGVLLRGPRCGRGYVLKVEEKEDWYRLWQ